MSTYTVDNIEGTTSIQDNNDVTKKLKFDLSNITPSTTRTITVPNANITLVDPDLTQTLTNKTINADNNTITNITNTSIKSGAGIDAVKIADGSVSNTKFQYLSGLTSSVVGLSDNQTLTNKTFTDTLTYFQDNSDNSKKIQFELSGITTGTTRVLTIPDSSTTLVGTGLSQTLVNKTIDADNNTITNIDNDNIKLGANIDATKIGDGSVSNTEFQYLGSLTSSAVGMSDTQTLTNKTINSASNTITIATSDITSGTMGVVRGGTGVTTLTQDGILKGNGTGAITSIKSNWGANVGPITTDDSGSGYEVGSRWIDTTANKEYICLDATETTAIWKETSGIQELTTRGDIIYNNSSGVARLPIGSNGQLLGTDGTDVMWRDSVKRLNFYVKPVQIASIATTINIRNTNLGVAIDPTIGTMPSETILTLKIQGSSTAQESTDINLPAGSAFTASGTADYFTINSTTTEYYVWYDVDNGNTDPTPVGKTGIEINITAPNTAIQVADATQVVVDAIGDFEANGVAFLVGDDEEMVLGFSIPGMCIVRLPPATDTVLGWRVQIGNDINSTSDLQIEDAGGNRIHALSYGKNNIIYSHDNQTTNGVWVINNFQAYNTKFVGKANAEFISINEALESITDNSSTNQYIINIGPGEFIEEPFVLKEYVYLLGSTSLSTTIVAKNVTDTIVTTSSYTSIHNINIKGASNGIGFLVNNVTKVMLHNMQIRDCDTLIKITATSTATDIKLHQTIFCGTYAKGMWLDGRAVTSSAQITVKCSGCNNYGSSTVGSNTVRVEGSYATLYMNGAIFDGKNQGTGILVSDGANMNISTSRIIDYITAINVENVGAFPHIHISNIEIDNCTNDVIASHGSAEGFISGLIDTTKTTINSPNISLNLIDDYNYDTVITGGLSIGKTLNKSTNVYDMLTNNDMGLIVGGELTAGTGALDIDVAAGFGYVMKVDYDGNNENHQISKITWSDDTITLSANTTSYIYYDSNGTLMANTSRPHITQTILIGRVRTDGTTREFIERSNKDSHHYTNKNDQYVREVLQRQYVSGSTVTANASRQIAVSGGVFYFAGTRYAPSGQTSPVTFYQYNHVSSTWTCSSQTVVNNTQYDNGTDLTSLTASYWAKHILYVVGDGTDERYMLCLAQEEHATLQLAQDGSLPAPPIYFNDGVTIIASFIVQQGTSTIVEILDERPRLSSVASATASVSSHGDLTGLNNDDHTQYLLHDGTRTMTGILNMGAFAITNIDTVDGVNISAHASRHLPNGLDALVTAAPLANITSTSINNGGTANSFARSDHMHAIDSTIITTTGTQTMTNKTLTSPIISTISNTGTITLPVSTDTLIGRSTTDTLTNKTLTSPILITPQINDTSADHQYVFDVSELTSDRTVTLPLLTSNDTFVFENHAQTLTNKTINTLSNTISIAAEDVTSGTFADARIAASNITQHEGSITIGNLSGAPSGTVVGTTDTQTLTNKTLTSPVLTTPQINDTSTDHQYIFGVSELTLDRTITLPLLTGNDTFVFEDHTQTLTNKTINTASNTITITTADVMSGTFADSRIATSNVTQHEGSINHNNLSGYVDNEHLDWTIDKGASNIHQNNITTASITQHEGSITIGNLSGAPVGSVIGTTDTQTLTNKTLTSPILTTPQINDSSATNQYIFAVSELTLDRTITLPLLTSNDTFVFADHTQTLTNKIINTTNNTLTIAASDIDSGTFADARIASSNVTQYEGSINHDNLTGFVANEHIDHSAITITAGIGLTGGGDITASRTLDLAINSLTEDASPDGANDYLVTYDASGANHKKVLLNNLPGGGGTSYSIASATVPTSTTSTSYVLMNSMTITPAAGTYIVMFSCTVYHSNTNSDAGLAIFNDGTIVLNSERCFGWEGGAHTNDFRTDTHSQTVTTVNGSQTIEIRWATGGSGTYSADRRSLILIKV